MMQILSKWKVVVKFTNREVVFWVSDNFASNVLRKVADLDFTDAPEMPVSITVTTAERNDNAVAGLTQTITSTPVRA